MFLGLGLIAVPLVLFGMAATRYVPAEQLGDPTALTHMTVAIALLGDTGKWWMGIVSIAATVATLNALLAGIPALLYGMSHTQQARGRSATCCPPPARRWSASRSWRSSRSS
jgi:hypothetical protein